jgi:hypothetical protein
MRILTFALLLGAPLAAPAQTLLEHSAEARFQIDLKVPDAALKAFLPEGFTSSVATQGPAKDCNLRLIFIDRITVNGSNGKPVGKGSNRVIWLAAPVKDPAGANAQLIIGGLSEDPADAPGPFGSYLAAKAHEMRRSTIVPNSGPAIDSQDWAFEAATGEHLEMHIRYERGTGNKGNPADTRYYSAKTPLYVQISHQEQVLDILRNTTTNPPDRIKEFSIKAGGGSYAKLFDGTEKLLSWDNILWLNRSVSVP